MTDPILWTLILVQIALGAFDTLYHHEGTERLAWRPSQRRELYLHGVRNLVYGGLFFVLGWLTVHGLLAFVLMGIVAAEVVITLWDFVEEDRTRRLPATERITHTLLALNYGAITALILPILLEWSARPIDVEIVFRGGWSFIATVAAVGVCLFGLRDIAAANRARRLVLTDPAPLADALAAPKAVLVTGGTGFIGSRLVAALVAAGHAVTVLTRRPDRALGLASPLTVVTDLNQIPSNARIDAIVNLAGEPLADGLWTADKRRRILRSRQRTTRAVVRLIKRLEARPAVLVSGSAVGWYGLRQDENLTEASGGRPCFSQHVCDTWERTAAGAASYGVRVVTLRIGLVLGSQGGLLGRMLTPFEFGLGGPIGNGRQWMSWIGLDDTVRAIAHCIAKSDLQGPVNVTAPHPVRNVDFAKALGAAFRRPARIPVPSAPLRWGLRDLAEELLLGGQRVLPEKLLASGFRFRHPRLEPLLAETVGGMPGIAAPPINEGRRMAKGPVRNGAAP